MDSKVTSKEEDQQSRLYIQSFAKGLAVILAFRPGRREMNLPELAAETGMSKSAVQRFAFTLETLGYLRKDPDSKRYSLTPKVIELGYRYLLIDPILERASPYLLELNRKCGENINISEPDDTDMVYVGRFPGFHYMPVYMPIGRRLPMFCTSAGRAYLAALSQEQAAEMIDRSQLEKFTPTTVVDRQELLDLVEKARQDGYATANGEYYQGDLGIGIAIRDHHGQPAAVINMSAPSSRWSLPRMEQELAPQLLEVSRLISSIPPEPRKATPFKRGIEEVQAQR
ncbi:IclR family transcriptional regulator [Mesorhizobium sp. SP-1A]|uniref:IclR family transcriptional regulator n=1 Tax=Mesorhizobium sp. SP-1A TaxID=3077840 RepID=UPI0028F73410|nr:IclR family transcriptional regulator [Mesorhizobium sp. SP-1A]